MNPKTLGIFGGAALLSAAALFLVVRGQVVAPPTTPTNYPPPPPPPPVNVGQPQATVSFGNAVRATATLSQSHVLADSATDLFLNVDLQAANQPGARSPFAAVLVIDRSGSMAGVKIDDARDAALAFMRKLRDDDMIAVVSYGSDVTTDLRLSPVRDVRDLAQRRVMSIDAGGGTNIGGGLRAAIRELATTSMPRRVLLISDGRPTEGERNPVRLAAIAGDGREQGLTFSSMGVGLDYDENVMERIAIRGGGGFYHLRKTSALASILAKEFQAVESLVASRVRLRIDPGANMQIQEVFGYNATRDGNSMVVDLGDLSSGESRRLVARATARPSGQNVHPFASLGLTYQMPASGGGESAQGLLSVAAVHDQALAGRSQNADVMVAGYKVEAAAAVSASMEAMSRNDKTQAVQVLRDAKARMKKAAANAPAAAAPALRQQAVYFDDMDTKAGAADLGSAAGQDFVKSNRAEAFSSQRR
ncbi:MAG: VWA domain-containing protein [Pseudomonadota bacterium]